MELSDICILYFLFAIFYIVILRFLTSLKKIVFHEYGLCRKLGFVDVGSLKLFVDRAVKSGK